MRDCRVEGCTSPVRCKGWCEMHYQMARRAAKGSWYTPYECLLCVEIEHLGAYGYDSEQIAGRVGVGVQQVESHKRKCPRLSRSPKFA